MAGEAGEACNIVKKIRRLEDELYRKNNKVAQPISEEYKEMLKKELGDVVCYVDLLAARAGINLEEAVVHKFNEVSDRMGSDIKL
jgi:NTP pyrophosphatase (non-canonical NTP hydrolase)